MWLTDSLSDIHQLVINQARAKQRPTQQDFPSHLCRAHGCCSSDPNFPSLTFISESLAKPEQYQGIDPINSILANLMVAVVVTQNSPL